MAKKASKLSDDEIARRLSSLPRWRRDGDFICRRFETHGWKGTLMAINAVGHLCEAAWHHRKNRGKSSPGGRARKRACRRAVRLYRELKFGASDRARTGDIQNHNLAL